MKKLKEKRARFLKIFGLCIFLFVALITTMSPSTTEAKCAAGGLALITLAIPANATDAEKATLAELEKGLNSIVTKFEKEYISEKKYEDKLKTLLTDYIKKDAFDEKAFTDLQEICKNHGISLGKLQTEMKTNTPSIKKFIADVFKDSETVDGINSFATSKIEHEIFTIKAVDVVGTGNATTTTGGIALVDLITASQDAQLIKLQDTFIEQFATVFPISTPYHTYVDYVPKEGAVANYTEGNAGGQVDFTIEINVTAKVCKSGGYIILNDNTVTDIPYIQSVASTILLKKTLLKKQDNLLFGTGVGDEPKGVTKFAKSFDASLFTDDADKKINPNLLDVIRAMADQIYQTHNWTDDVEYMPNVVYVNYRSWTNFIGTKSPLTEMYIFPNFQLSNGATLDNLIVIPKTKIPKGKILIGDFSKLFVGNYVTYETKMGMINDQFIKDQQTIKGSTRYIAYVKKYNEKAFIYDDISNVIAGIQVVK